MPPRYETLSTAGDDVSTGEAASSSSRPMPPSKPPPTAAFVQAQRSGQPSQPPRCQPSSSAMLSPTGAIQPPGRARPSRSYLQARNASAAAAEADVAVFNQHFHAQARACPVPQSPFGPVTNSNTLRFVCMHVHLCMHANIHKIYVTEVWYEMAVSECARESAGERERHYKYL